MAEKEIFDAHTEDLVLLFAIMVLADKRIYAVEVETFTKAVISYFHKTQIEQTPSEARLFLWFDTNRDRLKQILHAKNFEPWFSELVNRIKRQGDLSLLTTSLEHIARADNNIHVSETALLVLLKNYWHKAA